jgi:hypothetical protein
LGGVRRSVDTAKGSNDALKKPRQRLRFQLECSFVKGIVINDLLDFDLDFLEASAALIDPRLELLESATRTSPDPDAFGILDQIEYICGFGFVACQMYITEVASRFKLRKRDALVSGPTHRTGRSIAELVNSAANHWKHSPEWDFDLPITQAKQTLEVIQSLGVDIDSSYPVSAALYEILSPRPARFKNLIPFLTEWRDALPVPRTVLNDR